MSIIAEPSIYDLIRDQEKRISAARMDYQRLVVDGKMAQRQMDYLMGYMERTLWILVKCQQNPAAYGDLTGRKAA